MVFLQGLETNATQQPLPPLISSHRGLADHVARQLPPQQPGPATEPFLALGPIQSPRPFITQFTGHRHLASRTPSPPANVLPVSWKEVQEEGTCVTLSRGHSNTTPTPGTGNCRRRSLPLKLPGERPPPPGVHGLLEASSVWPLLVYSCFPSQSHQQNGSGGCLWDVQMGGARTCLLRFDKLATGALEARETVHSCLLVYHKRL